MTNGKIYCYFLKQFHEHFRSKTTRYQKIRSVFRDAKSCFKCVKLCALLCLRGSRSAASNSLNFITNLYSMVEYNIVDLFFTNTIIDVNSPISADMMSAGAINDLLCMRDQKNTNFTSDELNQLLSFFCLNN